MSVPNNLTPELLRKLYLEDHLTDTEIAFRFSTYQANISRIRKKYGIATILKADRFDLPTALTARQISILIGSMLGDGRLRKTGSLTASFSEYHSDDQRFYLDWKAKEWGPFCSLVSPINDPRGYSGACLYTHASRLFHPYWKLFYPKGSGDKEFGNLDPASVDPLAVTVWFMDDGSRTESYARFSVGPNKESQNIQLQILKRFGITASIYSDDEDASILVDGRTDYSRFVDLISPYLLEGMNYKLDVKPRKAGTAPRDIVTFERVTELLNRGLTNEAIAKILGVTRSSLGRHKIRLGFPAMPSGRLAKKSKKTYDLDFAESLIKSLNQTSPDFVEQVSNILNDTDFPFLTVSKEEAKHAWDLLVSSTLRLDENGMVGIPAQEFSFCDRFFPYLFEAYYCNNPSTYSAWHDKNRLKDAINYQIKSVDSLTPRNVFEALRFIIKAPINFSPYVAKALVEAYCPEGGIVLDPCAGYGGRACGALAAKRKYIGVEPHPKAKLAFNKLRAVIGDFTFYNEAFEDVSLGDFKVNLVLTSPPCFSLERYSNDIKQSWVRYKTWSAWVQGFLLPFVSKSWEHLLPGGFMVVSTKNVQLEGHNYPIADELIRLTINIGFSLECTLFDRSDLSFRKESVYVFKKPSMV